MVQKNIGLCKWVVEIKSSFYCQSKSWKKNKGNPIFMRWYVFLKACKERFMSCQTITGLDSCFLKGKYWGKLFTTIGRNGDD